MRSSFTILVLALVLALFCNCPSTVLALDPFDFVTRLSGPLPMWEVFDYMAFDFSYMNRDLRRTTEEDFNDILNDVATVTVSQTMINTTGYYVICSITPTSASTTEEEIEAILVGRPLPSLSAFMAEQCNSSLAGVADIVPDVFTVYTPILPDPPEGYVPPTKAPAIIVTLRTQQTMLISGDPTVWRAALTLYDDIVMAAAVCAAAVKAAAVPNTNVHCTGTVTVLNANPKLTSMGNGQGGLLTRLHMTQSIYRDGLVGYDADQMMAVLKNMNCSSLEAYYSGTAGSDGDAYPSSSAAAIPTSAAAMTRAAVKTTLTVVAVSSEEVAAPYRCTDACKGMIALGAIAVAVMVTVVIIVLFTVCGCCCCCCGPHAHLKKQASSEESSEVKMVDSEPVCEADVAKDGVAVEVKPTSEPFG